MEGYSDSLRRELLPHGVSVSVVEPGYVKSSIFTTNDAAIAAMMEDDDISDKIAQTYPLLYSEAGKKKRADDIASASSPVVTSEAIKHAISAKFPQTRYVVASGGKMPAAVAVFLVWLMPDRLVDALMP